MIATEAEIPTERANRYLVQLAEHLEHLRDPPHNHSDKVPDRPTVTSLEWTQTAATIAFDRGRCVLKASTDTLTVRVEASDEERLTTLQQLIGHRLQTIGRRDHLRPSWRPTSGF